MLELLADLSNRHGVRVENLDDILPQAMRDAEHIAYLRIWEVRAGGEEPLQRLDRASHREWMRIAGYELDEELEDQDEDDEDTWYGHDASDPLADEPEPTPVDAFASAPAALDPLDEWRSAMVHYIVHVAARNVIASRMVKLRVRAYAVKGHSSPFGRTFTVENLRYEAQVDPAMRPTKPQEPPKSMEEADMRAAMPGMAALASFYERHTRHVMEKTEDLVGIHERITQRAYDELGEVRKDVNALYREIASERRARVDEKVQAAERHNEAIRSEQETQERRELIKQSLDQFGEVAKAVMMSKGVPAELIPVLERLNAKPELMAALKDPNVLEMLDDPEAVEGLAQLLQQAAAQAVEHKRAQQAATEEPPPPPA